MDRVYQANAIETPPSTTASSGSYPTAGNKAAGQLATVPGPYWFYSITEEIRNALIAAGVTPDAAKVNQLAEAMGKFLPLSGGTMTGAIKTSATSSLQSINNTSAVQVHGGAGYGNGAYINLRGKNRATEAGVFSICATDGTTNKILMGIPDGTLTWENKNIVRSVNGTSADASGNVTISLPSPKAYVSEAWKSSDGKKWYRKWSDGWIEQGGIATSESNFDPLTFPTAFTNTNYSIVGSFSADTMSDSTSWSWYSRKTTAITGRIFTIGLQGTCYYMWYACGY